MLWLYGGDMFVLMQMTAPLQTGTAKSTSASGATIMTRCPVWRARGRRSAVGSEGADVGEEEAGGEAEEAGEVSLCFF